MENFETPESEALRNEVVWQCLGSYLSPGDLKDCRLVSKNVDQKVRGLKKWKGRMQLHLTRRADVWGPPGFRIAEGTHFEAVKLTLSVGGVGSEEAVEKAQEAARGTQEATRRAQDAAQGAEQAAQRAQEAAEGVQEATHGARVAVAVARQAPRGSREAAERAQVAAERAQEATQRALETAERAQAAVKRAQETAQKVEVAATLAQAAVDMTQDAARRAQRAAQEAQDAAEEETNGAKDWSKIFKIVKSLELEFDEKEIRNFDEIELEPLRKTLAFILGHCTSALTTLIIDGNTLGAVDFSAILGRSTGGLERIQGLKKLEVTNGKREHKFTGKYMSRINLASKMRRFDNSVQFLGNEIAALEDLTISQKQGSFDRNLRDFVIPRVNVLKKLEIKEIDAVNVEGISALVFPNLTHLSLRVSESSAKLCDFLGKQPDLQGLTLKIQGKLSQNLLKVIKTKGANLVALTLKCWQMDMEKGENWWERNWAFLASFKKLREFSFTVSTSSDVERQRVDIDVASYAEDIFTAMPKGLMKISIRLGFGSKVATRRRILENFRSEAQKFKELEELSIFFLLDDEDYDDEDDDDSEDEFLRFIGTKTGENKMFPFPKLRKLHLSDVRICNKRGKLLGQKAFWAGLQDVSIRNVRNDREVSEDSIIRKLSGTEIRRLSLRGVDFRFQMSKEGVQKIVKKNKCLEALTSNHPGIERAHRLKTATYCKDIEEEVDSDSDVEADPPDSDSDSSGDDDDVDSDDNLYLDRFFDIHGAMDEGSDEDNW